MADDGDLRATTGEWLVVAFAAGAIVGGAISWSAAWDEAEDRACMLEAAPRAFTLQDFNLAPYDCEGNLVTNPSPVAVRNQDGVHVVACLVNEATGEPFHFQAIDEDTRLFELDPEFSTCRGIFRYGDHERVVDVFEKIRSERKRDER